jgi:hypothetical protein
VELLIPIFGLGSFVLIVDLIRRLIGQAILNGTIRRALEKDPAMVPLLIEKLETRSPIPIALVGWIVLILGAMLALSAGLSDSLRGDDWIVAAATIGTGATIVTWDHLNRKQGAARLRSED